METNSPHKALYVLCKEVESEILKKGKEDSITVVYMNTETCELLIGVDKERIHFNFCVYKYLGEKYNIPCIHAVFKPLGFLSYGQIAYIAIDTSLPKGKVLIKTNFRIKGERDENNNKIN